MQLHWGNGLYHGWRKARGYKCIHWCARYYVWSIPKELFLEEITHLCIIRKKICLSPPPPHEALGSNCMLFWRIHFTRSCWSHRERTALPKPTRTWVSQLRVPTTSQNMPEDPNWKLIIVVQIGIYIPENKIFIPLLTLQNSDWNSCSENEFI